MSTNTLKASSLSTQSSATIAVVEQHPDLLTSKQTTLSQEVQKQFPLILEQLIDSSDLAKSDERAVRAEDTPKAELSHREALEPSLGFPIDDPLHQRLLEIFRRLVVAADIDRNCDLIPFNSRLVNVYVFTQFRSRIERATGEEDLTSDEIPRAVYLSLGFIKDFDKYLKEQTKSELREALEPLGLGELADCDDDKLLDADKLAALPSETRTTVNLLLKEIGNDSVTEDDVAAVIAHELQHIRQRIDPAAASVLNIKESHQLEFNADSRGMQDILAKAGFNPRAMERLLKFITARGNYISHTHPNGTARERLINRIISDPEVPLSSLSCELAPLDISTAPSSFSEKFFEFVAIASDRYSLADRLTEHFNKPHLAPLIAESVHAVKKCALAQHLENDPSAIALLGATLAELGTIQKTAHSKASNKIRLSEEEIANLRDSLGKLSNPESQEAKYLESLILEEERLLTSNKDEQARLESGDISSERFNPSLRYYELTKTFSNTESNTPTSRVSTLWRGKENLDSLGNEDINQAKKVLDSKVERICLTLGIDIDVARELGIAYLSGESIDDPDLANLLVRGTLAFSHLAENSHPNNDLTPVQRVILGVATSDMYFCRRSRSDSHRVTSGLSEPIKIDLSARNPELSNEQAKRIADLTLSILVHNGSDHTDQNFPHLEALRASASIEHELSLIVDTASRYSLPSELLHEDLPLGDRRNLPDNGLQWISNLNLLVTALSPLKPVPFGTFSKVVERTSNLAGRTYFNHELAPIAALQETPKISEITAENVIIATLNLMTNSNLRPNPGLFELLRTLPSLELTDERKRILRREILAHCVTDIRCILGIYGYDTKLDSLNGATALELMRKLSMEGLSNHAFSLALNTLSLNLRDQDPSAAVVLFKARLASASNGAIKRKTEISSQDELDRLCVYAGLSLDELIPQLPSLGISLYPRAINSNWTSNRIQLSKPQLLNYAQACATHKRQTFSLTDRDTQVEQERHAEELGLLLLKEVYLHDDPTFIRLVGTSRDLSSVWPSLVFETSLPSKDFLLTEIPPSTTRDWMLIARWQQDGGKLDDALSLLNVIDCHSSSSGPSESSASFHTQIIYNALNLGESNPLVQEMIKVEESGKLPDCAEAVIQAGTTPAMTLIHYIFASGQPLLYDNSLPFNDRIDSICNQIAPSELRDHLLSMELARELCSISGDTFSVTQSELEIHRSLASEISIACPLRHSLSYSRPRLNSLDEKTRDYASMLARKVCDLTNSAASRSNLAKLILTDLRPSNLDRELKEVLDLLPDPSPLRDSFISRAASRYPLTLKQARSLRELLTDASMANEKSSATLLLGLQAIGTISKQISTTQRAELVSWLCGAQQDQPWYLKAAGGFGGTSYSSVPERFKNLTKPERLQILRELLLGEGGVFEHNGSAGQTELDRFISTVFEATFKEEFEFRDTFKKVALSLFKHSRPERRFHYFDALTEAYIAGSNTETPNRSRSYETVALFLEQTPLGCKMMQMLCYNNRLPLELREAFSKRRSSAREISKLAVAARISNSQLEIDPDQITIDKSCGTASMKQGNFARFGENVGVLKTLKPTVEKFYEDDFITMQSVIADLRQSGVAVPRYLLSSLNQIILEESDVANESSQQVTFSRTLASDRFHGDSLKVPKIHLSANDWVFEEMASGESLAKLASSIKQHKQAAYETASTRLGLLLARQIAAKGEFHADLHDENSFLEISSGVQTLIDCGAIGIGDSRLLKLFLAIARKDHLSVVDQIIESSVEHIVDSPPVKRELSKRLEILFNSNYALDEMANRLSYELLDYSLPSRELRYALKALGAAGHHLERIRPTLRDLKAPSLALEKLLTLGQLAISIYRHS